METHGQFLGRVSRAAAHFAVEINQSAARAGAIGDAIFFILGGFIFLTIRFKKISMRPVFVVMYRIVGVLMIIWNVGRLIYLLATPNAY